jgi:hypothetical protein
MEGSHMVIRLFKYHNINSHGLALCLLGLAAAYPAKTNHLTIKWISKPLEILTNKNDPPRLLFEHLKKESLPINPEFENLDKSTESKIDLQSFSDQTLTVTDIRSRKIEIPEVKISYESTRDIVNAGQIDLSDLNLNRAQKMRIEELQRMNKSISISSEEPESVQQAASEAVAQQLVVQPQQIKPQYDQGRGKQTLTGNIVVTEGLPFVKGSTIEVRHKEDDVYKELGSWDRKTNQFVINVDNKSGFLVAKLLNENGFPVGEGTLRLSESNQGQYKITIKKAKNDYSTTISQFDNPNRKVKANHYYSATGSKDVSDELGTFNLPGIHPNSFSVGHFEANEVKRKNAPDYLPSLSIFASGEHADVPMFRKKMIDSLKMIATDFGYQSEYEPNGSVIWGQVKQDGKIVSGISVEVEGHPSAKIIYFNQMLFPDPTLKATSDSGYFAVLDLPEGVYQLLAKTAGNYFSHANIPVQADTVSPVELKGTLTKNKMSIKVFDAFEGSGQVAEVTFQNFIEPVIVEGLSEQFFPDLHRWSVAEITPQDPTYNVIRMSYLENHDSFNIPLIKDSWLQKMITSRRINQIPQTGVIVGFVPQDKYELYLPQLQEHIQDNVVFFDSSGEAVDRPVPGGGFILFNVPTGLHTVSMLSSQNEFINSQLAIVDVNTVYVIKAHFEM